MPKERWISRKRIRERREKLGLTSKELAQKCEVTESAIKNWEAGIQLPSQEVVAKIADELSLGKELIKLTEIERGRDKIVKEYKKLIGYVNKLRQNLQDYNGEDKYEVRAYYELGVLPVLKGRPDDMVLIRDPNSGKTYLFKNRRKHHIINPEWLGHLIKANPILEKRRYDWDKASLEKYPEGAKIIGDGLIIKGSIPDIYLYQNGEKRPFHDGNSFKERGYDFQSNPDSSTHVLLPDNVLNNIPTGKRIYARSAAISLNLYFEWKGKEVQEFSVKDTKVAKVGIEGDGYTAYPYLRVTTPDGKVRYAYHPDGKLDTAFRWSNKKIPYIIAPNGDWISHNITNETWIFDIYTFTGNEQKGKRIWEFWFEDVNKGSGGKPHPIARVIGKAVYTIV